MPFAGETKPWIELGMIIHIFYFSEDSDSGKEETYEGKKGKGVREKSD